MHGRLPADAIPALRTAQINLKETMGFLIVEASDEELMNVPWFGRYFPADLEVRHVVAAYAVIERNA